LIFKGLKNHGNFLTEPARVFRYKNLYFSRPSQGEKLKFYMKQSCSLPLFFLLILFCGACNEKPQNATAASPQPDTAPLKADHHDLLEFLQGRWRSADDSTYVIEFSGTAMRHLNGGELTQETTIEIDDDCRNTACNPSGEPGGWCFIEKVDGGEQCNRVIQGADGLLQYRATGATRDLSFKKIQ
jgi:hypothetical protein